MTVDRSEREKNRFKKILDDAGRSLEDLGDFRFLNDLPGSAGDGSARVPFPYGTQPESKIGWK